jgi:hypothetical protein
VPLVVQLVFFSPDSWLVGLSVSDVQHLIASDHCAECLAGEADVQRPSAEVVVSVAELDEQMGTWPGSRMIEPFAQIM